MPFRSPRPRTTHRRGVTLIEMLVTVALLVLMMTIIVQIFQAATGAVSAAKTYQELDSSLRQLDATIRQDLGNLTVKKMTPPLDPKLNQGYFEYIENSFADLQGEDTDDCLRFTVKAPEGQAFSGKMFPAAALVSMNATISGATGAPSNAQFDELKQFVPITVESQFAEVIYFLRNGNLYRRVLLVAPERQSVVAQASNLVAGVFSPQSIGTTGTTGQTLVSWQGLNDLSAHPVPTLSSTTIILNTLGDLTNRENRFCAPRFCNDFGFFDTTATTWKPGPDGVADDTNADTVNDFYPTLYWNMPGGLRNEPGTVQRGAVGANFSTVAFPYIYPYAYTKPDPTSSVGWIHGPDPSPPAAFPMTSVAGLARINHSPLDFGDSLAAPSGIQTWLGFPTWRETMSPNWLDPTFYPGGASPSAQAKGLNPFAATNTTIPAANATEQLPPMTIAAVGTASVTTGGTTPYRIAGQLFNDGNGADTFAVVAVPKQPIDFLWKQCWEDDLIMTGVRSFDVKAYDNSYPGYVDLGWGDDGRLFVPFFPFTDASGTTITAANWTPPLLTDNSSAARLVAPANIPQFPLVFNWPPASKQFFSLIGQTYAHEGRIPPLPADFRLDPQMTNELIPSANPAMNVGDSSGDTVRLRRVWDTWSTDYTNAPSSAVNPSNGLPWGASIGGSPVYPSYPPPYSMSLRGIQIQIRAVDPRNERVKVLTIRQDFSDRL